MTYWGINMFFLAASALVLLGALVLRRPRRALWGALGGSAALLFVLTAVFDNLMIAAGIMAYSTDQNVSGVQVGLAPLEDFAYPLAGVLLLPALWLLLGGRVGGSPGPTAARRAGPRPVRSAAPANAREDDRLTGDA